MPKKSYWKRHAHLMYGDPLRYRTMLPDELRALRTRLGLTGRQFARIIRVFSERAVRRYEAGDRPIPPNVAALAKLAVEFPEVRDRLLAVEMVKRPELEEPPLEPPDEPYNAPPPEEPRVYSGLPPLID
jgi:transcriptional regulator with XRE-family HTH domain